MVRLVTPLLLCSAILGCALSKVGDQKPWDNFATAADMSQEALKRYRTSEATTHGALVYNDVPLDIRLQYVEKHGNGFTAVSSTVDIGTWAAAILCKLGIVRLTFLSQYEKDGKCIVNTAEIGVGAGLLANYWEEKKFTDSGIKWGDGKSVGLGFFGYDHHADGPVWLRLFWIPIRVSRGES